MKAQEHIRESNQLHIRCALRQEHDETITRLFKGLNPNILDRVELQPCGTFDFVCKLAIKMEK